MINNYKEIISYSMAFIKDDFTELWVIVNKIYEQNPQLNFNELIEATKAIVSDLITNHKINLINEETHILL